MRRLLLDPILAQAAMESGAEVRMATTVTGLVERAGRVTGVRVAGGHGTETELGADLVVGADGRHSTVAKLCAARKYNVTPHERFAYWTFFEGADHDSEPTVVFHRWDTRIVLACPADSGLYLIAVAPELCELEAFRRDVGRCFAEVVASCEPVANVLSGARRVGRFFGALRWAGYFREPSGPGWVLVGDAGHFKDPSAGRGIGDAFRQVDALAPAIVAGLDGSGLGLDDELARWSRWRDDDFAGPYWFATDVGKARPFPAVAIEILRRAQVRGRLDRFMDLLNHRSQPSELVIPTGALRTTARLLARRGADRRRILSEALTLASEGRRRRWLNKRPAYTTGKE